MNNYPENIVRAIGVPLTTYQLTELESKIDSLPARYRDALFSHYRDGLTYQRIADENGFVSPSAAWACVRTGLGRLRRMYGAKMGRKETASTPSTPSTPEADTVSTEQISHELAVARNDRDVYIDTAGEGWFEGFAAPRASEFFTTRFRSVWKNPRAVKAQGPVWTIRSKHSENRIRQCNLTSRRDGSDVSDLARL